MSRRALALGLAAAVLGSAGLLVAARSEGTGTAGGDGAETVRSTSSARVLRQDLIARTEVDGTLGYSGSFTVAGQLQGTVTAVPAAGTVVERGQSLYSVDDRPVTLLYGDLPAWRQMGPGMSDGPDVKQLEENLVALGHATGGDLAVDEKFSAATSAAVKRWQKALGVEESGVVELGQAVFLPGASRVAQVTAEKGPSAPPG